MRACRVWGCVASNCQSKTGKIACGEQKETEKVSCKLGERGVSMHVEQVRALLDTALGLGARSFRLTRRSSPT